MLQISNSNKFLWQMIFEMFNNFILRDLFFEVLAKKGADPSKKRKNVFFQKVWIKIYSNNLEWVNRDR